MFGFAMYSCFDQKDAVNIKEEEDEEDDEFVESEIGAP
tara:strand:- start:604 stop:717 length:114 start_codon:yes stop_codon:yes gene_type:complete